MQILLGKCLALVGFMNLRSDSKGRSAGAVRWASPYFLSIKAKSR